MVDWFQGKTSMQESLQRFGYAKLTLNQKCIFGEAGDQIKIHEFHRSKAEIESAGYMNSIKKKKVNCQTMEMRIAKGARRRKLCHIHFYSNLDFAHNFVNSCLRYKEKK